MVVDGTPTCKTLYSIAYLELSRTSWYCRRGSYTFPPPLLNGRFIGRFFFAVKLRSRLRSNLSHPIDGAFAAATALCTYARFGWLISYLTIFRNSYGRNFGSSASCMVQKRA